MVFITGIHCRSYRKQWKIYAHLDNRRDLSLEVSFEEKEKRRIVNVFYHREFISSAR